MLITSARDCGAWCIGIKGPAGLSLLFLHHTTERFYCSGTNSTPSVQRKDVRLQDCIRVVLLHIKISRGQEGKKRAIDKIIAASWFCAT